MTELSKDGEHVVSEFDLGCATCGGSLTRSHVSPETIGVETTDPLEVAECANCGGRYFPRNTLDAL
ncbi:zf-TFIIB domain-containing protein [Haloarchaeobius sp. HME9146]|uniref:zf-TFIIB domain-containing protein n=1 Tax=Haloarchaeobius sp. HME9146 TaxID=2978732 RepID=UPI0021BF8559|nr:zf-TFIIB domain-containing protein [Haloarchaeobius sp. HME9146]MCT9097291.1 zf-TFIIB domain-containing protein [Haloarchaeobius sp. HME9146]